MPTIYTTHRPQATLDFPAQLPRPEVAALRPRTLADRIEQAGLCAGTRSDRWDDPGKRTRHTRQAERARAACAGCPVVQECLEDALRMEAHRRTYLSGIRGALAPWERRELLKRREAEAAQAAAGPELAEAAS